MLTFSIEAGAAADAVLQSTPPPSQCPAPPQSLASSVNVSSPPPPPEIIVLDDYDNFAVGISGDGQALFALACALLFSCNDDDSIIIVVQCVKYVDYVRRLCIIMYVPSTLFPSKVSKSPPRTRQLHILTVVCDCHACTHRICCDDDEIRKVTNSFDEGSRLLELSLDH